MTNVKKPKIIAIDDTKFICDTLTSWLKMRYDIHTFTSGKNGLEYFAANEDVDLVLLDYDMPSMTGYEVLIDIRSGHSTQKNTKVPVIFLTGVTNERMEVEMMERGADAFIRKPLDIAKLNEHIEKLLENKQ